MQGALRGSAGSALGSLCSIHAPPWLPAPTCCRLIPVDQPEEVLFWNCFGFSHPKMMASCLCQGGAASSSAPYRAWTDYKWCHCFGRLPEATLRSAYPLPGGIQVILLPLSSHPVLPSPLSVHLGCPICLPVPLGAAWESLCASQDTPHSSWCLSGHPRTHHLPFGAAQEPPCAFQFAPWAFWCPLHPLTASSDPSRLRAFFLCPQNSLAWSFLHQKAVFGFFVLAATVFLLMYPRALRMPFGRSLGGLELSWGCQTIPGLSVCCPRTGLVAKISF